MFPPFNGHVLQSQITPSHSLPSSLPLPPSLPVPQENGFDPSLSVSQTVDSPMSVNDGDHPPNDTHGAFGMGGGLEGGGGEKKPGIDVLLSATAVKIDNNLDQIFEESDEEDEGGLVVRRRGEGGGGVRRGGGRMREREREDGNVHSAGLVYPLISLPLPLSPSLSPSLPPSLPLSLSLSISRLTSRSP